MLAQPPVPAPHQRAIKGRGAAGGANANTTTVGAGADEPGVGLLVSGKSYPFQLALTNPLYDPIQVRLSIQRALPSSSTLSGTGGGGGSTKPARAPFAISLPTTPFAISAFAEAWEYEDDDEMYMDDEELEDMIAGREVGAGTGTIKGRGGVGAGSAGDKGGVGVLERKANITKIGGEVVLGKDASGDIKVRTHSARLFCTESLLIFQFPSLCPIVIACTRFHVLKFNMLVSYTYRSDEPQGGADDAAANTSRTGEMKTFSFYTIVFLGTVAPREDTRQSLAPSGT